MNEQQFQQEVEALFLHIEEQLEAACDEVECEPQEGLLTLTLASKEQIVLSRQLLTQEIWLASKKGAYHFRRETTGWFTSQGQSLPELLTNLLQQAGFKIRELSL